jgi:transposase
MSSVDGSVVAVGASARAAVCRPNTTLLDCIMQVDHQAQRIELLEGAIDRAVAAAPTELRAPVDALQALRGVAKVTAVTLATEFGTFSRFERAAQVMSYTGVVPSEHSSGPRTRRSGITKTGNSHLRRVLVEAAWHYRHKPRICQRQHVLQQTLSPKVAAIAWRAQERLHRRYWALAQKGKPAGKIVTALARELVGFVWAIGVETEQQLRRQKAA